MTPTVRQLNTPEHVERAMATVRRWQSGQRDGLICPVCSATGLAVTDQSTRPHTAWYHLACEACGLNEAIAVPEGAYPRQHDS